MNNLIKKYLETPIDNNAYTILNTLRRDNTHETLLLLGKYFINKYPYSIHIKMEVALSLFYTKKYKECFNLYKKILKYNLPEKLYKQINTNFCYCIEYIKDKYCNYNENLVSKIKDNSEYGLGLVTFTITSCKRLDLFKRTMNSFLNCCSDIEKIDKWLCVDDNSSPEDRKKMEILYPFFTFYWKTPEEKGHPRSMNIIRDRVMTPYVFHMEDDWQFFHKKKYITECMEVLQHPKIGQCLINKNYSETPGDVGILGGVMNRTPTGLRYFIHEYCPTNDSKKEFVKKYGNGPNCCYWPHFSFRPSLVKTSILKELGPYNEQISHFEMDYSYKYNRKYISAFLDSIYSIHIGRLTSERNDKTIPNAYELNDEAQFTAKEKRVYAKEIVREVVKEVVKEVSKEISKDIPKGIKIYVVNLDNRPDRINKFKENFNFPAFSYSRFSAIRGKNIKPNDQLQRIFEGNDYDMRSGMVGCAMSHIKMYIELINSNYDLFCVFEDDIGFTPNFQEKLIHLYNTNKDTSWDLIYLGHHLRSSYIDKEVFDKEKMPVAEKWDARTSLVKSMGGTFGYIITREGAKKMLEFINTHGMTNGIDTVQQKAANNLNIYYCKPHLVYSEFYTGQNTDDTDIQTDFTSLTIPLKDRVESEMGKYFPIEHIGLSSDDNISKNTIENLVENAKDGESAFCQGKLQYIVSKMKNLQSKQVPCYNISNTLFIVPKPSKEQLDNIYFDRLKKNGEYNIDDALEFLPELKYKFTNNWFGRNVDISMKLLKTMFTGKKLDILEIGSHEGRSSMWMAENLCKVKNSSFTSVEPFIMENTSTHIRLNTKNNFIHNIEVLNSKNYNVNFIHINDTSRNTFPKLNTKYDIIYHISYTDMENVFYNLSDTRKLLRKGGVILLDDVGFDHDKDSGVMGAIKKFLDIHPTEYEVILREYQWAFRKV